MCVCVCVLDDLLIFFRGLWHVRLGAVCSRTGVTTWAGSLTKYALIIGGPAHHETSWVCFGALVRGLKVCPRFVTQAAMAGLTLRSLHRMFPRLFLPWTLLCVCVCLRRLAHLFSEAFACPAKDSLQKNRCYYSARSRLTSARFLPADV